MSGPVALVLVLFEPVKSADPPIISDYCRNAIRMSALQRTRVIYVLTHDSIGVGEDGPTHQPVEQIASLRAVPHLSVFRPCDAVETAECWEIALNSRDS